MCYHKNIYIWYHENSYFHILISEHALWGQASTHSVNIYFYELKYSTCISLFSYSASATNQSTSTLHLTNPVSDVTCHIMWITVIIILNRSILLKSLMHDWLVSINLFYIFDFRSPVDVLLRLYDETWLQPVKFVVRL